MTKRNIKYLALCLLTVVAAKVPLAGCYPLVPGIFTAIFLEGGSRGLLMILSIFGLVLFLPIQSVVKYALMLLVIGTSIKLVEWINKSCRTWLGALLGALSTFALIAAGEIIRIPGLESIQMAGTLLSVFESLFVFSFVLLATPIFHFFLGGRKPESKDMRMRVRVPESGERLQSYAESFTGLARLFSQMSHPKDGFGAEEMGKLQQEITGKVCFSCNQSALCWEQANSPLQEVFYTLVRSVERMGMPDREVEEQLSYYCPYASSLVEEAIDVFEKARLNLSWHNRLLENREVIAQQLDAMAYIMEDCAKEYTDVTKEKGKMVTNIRYRLKERGALTKELNLYEKKNGRYSLHVKLSSKWGNYIALKNVTKAVSEAMKISMVPVKSSKTLFGKETSTLSFEEAPDFYALYGVARRTKDEARISGDNFSLLDLEVGESVLTLSDGMGSGIRACKESEMVIELIERFLEAGFQKETAIRMMNSAMVMQGEDGMYSTMDMASIDLYSGECQFYKIGASASFIKRGAMVEMIASSGLPVGIYPHVEIERDSRILENGDFLLLLSDGVMDYLCVPNPEEKIKEILETIELNNPGKLANQVMEQILMFTGGKVPDDMTILAAGVWEK